MMVKIKILLQHLLTFLLCCSYCFMENAEKNPIKKRPTDNKKQSVCAKLNLDVLLLQKAVADKKLSESVAKVKQDKKMPAKTKKHRLQAISIFQREMNDSVMSLYNSIDNLKSFVKGDYRSVRQLKETSKKRLEQLKTSILEAEQDFNEIIEAEKEEITDLRRTDNHSQNIVKKFINDMIVDVAKAADSLEGRLDDDEFEHKIHDGQKIDIQTVIKVGGEAKNDFDDNEGVVMLVDSESNHFVLSKPKDGTTTHVDHILIREIMMLIITTFFFTLVCSLLKLPTIFACILSGILLGPSGYGYLKSIVQIESMGEFGVCFILFCVGMEFSPDKLKKVIRTSMIGSSHLFLSYVLIGLFWGSLFGILPRQSFFVTVCLSLTSTPMVVKLIESYKSGKGHDAASDSIDDALNLLVSMLFVQDATLGFFMAILPILAGHVTEKSHSFANVPGNGALHFWLHGTFGGPWETAFFTLFELLFALIGIFFVTYVLSKYAAAKFFRGLSLFASTDCFILGNISLLFLMSMVTEYAGVSMELGCFICGGVIGTMGEQTSKQVLTIVEPCKEFFSTLFFASIGFHIFPSFVISEIAIFIPVTALIIGTKFIVTSIVFHRILPDNKSKWLIAAGLSQMSEFAFVLGSRARRYGLIGREIYLIILSVTTLSLLIAPFIWRHVFSLVTHGGYSWNGKWIVKKLKSLPL